MNMTKEILLTQNKIALVDDGDFEELNKHKWCANIYKNTWYALRHDPLPSGKDRMVLMHRVILNPPKHLLVDHRDLNGLNNVRLNLREATYQDNNRNRRAARKNKTGFKGVYWKEDRNKWVSFIQVDKKTIYLGYYLLPEEAALAYNEAAIKYHGEFVRLNIINEKD